MGQHLILYRRRSSTKQAKNEKNPHEIDEKLHFGEKFSKRMKMVKTNKSAQQKDGERERELSSRTKSLTSSKTNA